MSAVITREKPSAVQHHDAGAAPTDAMVSMLERVLMDPSVPVERLERLLELQDKERQRRAKEDFSRSMADAQKQMRAVLVDKPNRQTNSKYASYAALDAMVRPIYTEHGFSVTFNTESVAERPDVIRIVAFVENGGFERRYEVEMPCDGKGAKGNDVMTKTHAVKSAVTYGKATLLPMIFNLAVTDRSDDDGNGASPRGGDDLVSDEQVAKLRKALEFRGKDEEKFCRSIKVGALTEIYSSKFEDALRIINAGGAR